ncbi:FecR domain-containing protein [Thauera linaloolentis]|uniref:FecR family protein n=1 Tax=Thauera linaloolentis (strain DSM 12138 / JCM 21573 / CCUG 41526 / CIP 105981 / IAM 15112 / NBRC 102519 / 47Lol) TaxID=1123367 RepID=N6Y5V8_THAL4|nr:FecR domain-containing protein [Thauera linaloolentis]ENO86970.1 FecR family protein [Thauera linaloolentis 47Lol = DSM 12138]MCM8564429.1 FecR domain-containing protein [Thauera linaloolentis]
MNPSRAFKPLAPDAGPLDPKVVAQAAEWVVRLQYDDTLAARQNCDAWRAADPGHELAWQRLNMLGQDLRNSTRGMAAPQVATTLEQARDASRRSRRNGLKWMLGLGLTTGIAWQGRTLLNDARLLPSLLADQHTGTGERRNVTLKDGTLLTLNTRSAVDIAFDAHQRRLTLHTGEIMVSTAPDPGGRPFVIATPHGELLPVGTRFSVRRLAEDGHPIRVAVFEGAVDIRPRHGGPTRRLHAGTQSDFTADTIQPPETLRSGGDAWVRGMLVASRMPLDQFIAELARHRPGLLRCDPAVAGLQVTGAFPLDDGDRVLAMLEQVLPVRAEYRTRYWVTLTRR